MADSINVNTQVLRDTADKVRNINSNLDSKLIEINNSMNALEATWKSEAATEIRDAMNALKPHFEEYRNVIESYAKFLTNTAEKYENRETEIQSNASAFR